MMNVWWTNEGKGLDQIKFYQSILLEFGINFYMFDILPFSILTATVLQVESLSMPKAEASTTFPKAPWPRVLPGEGKKVGWH